MRRDDALAHVARGGTGRPVLVLHSWWGMTPGTTDFADRLAERGFLVGCADLYGGQLASTEAQARALRRAPRPEPMYRTLERAVAELGTHPASDGSRPGLVGFSMGGHWALWLAQRAEVGAAAAVVYYAARAVSTGGPVPVLAHLAEHDEFVSAAARRRMERSFDALGWPHREHVYPGTSHWFAERGEATFDAGAAARALERTADFLAAPTGGQTDEAP